MPDERPNPVAHHAHESALPRTAGARVRTGAETDPIPPGMAVRAAPEHHFPVLPSGHDEARREAGAARAGAASEVEEAKTRELRRVLPKSAAQGFAGAATAANKKMPSAHHTADFATSHHDKHQVGQPKQETPRKPTNRSLTPDRCPRCNCRTRRRAGCTRSGATSRSGRARAL
jgi:hypothetical protein